MADEVDQVDSRYWKSLVKIPETHLRGPDREDNGKAYSAILEELQIRSEVHEAFFNGNVRPFRNKKDNSVLIAKSDDDSLLKLSKSYLSAYGNIVWGKEREWLFSPDQLSKGETPLRYIMPKERRRGDHDRFYELLARLWRRMRSITFEIKPSIRRNYNLIDPTTASPTTTSTSRQRGSQSCITAVSPMRTRSDTSYSRETQSPMPGVAQQEQIEPDQDYRPRRPYVYEPTPPYEVSVPGYWLASRTEKVIMDAITDLAIAKRESHPKAFATFWERHTARMEEIEQYEEQQVAISIENDSPDIPGPDKEVTTQTDLNTGADDVSEDNVEDAATSTAGQPPEQQGEEEEDVTMQDTPSPSHTPTTTSRGTNTEPTIHNQLSLANQHRPTLPPSFPLTSYIPPTLPSTMTVYITPYSHTATHHAQPYIWPDAPVHQTSYIAFRNGIRLRANVPDSIADAKMRMVLGYGWNDFCSVVGGEDAWRNWFVLDLRRAAERGGVGVWRMRVCVVGS